MKWTMNPMQQTGTTRCWAIGTVLMLTGILVPVFPQTNAPGYIGCFVDVANLIFKDRALEGPKSDSDDQSVDWCFHNCLETKTDDYKYLGVEFMDECFCGNNEDYGRHGQENDSECNDPCKGNGDQICGDSDRISIYQVSQGVCSNDIGPPTNGSHTITNPRSLSYNLNNFKFYGTRVDFYCDTGFTLQGASYIQCIETQYNNVTWNDTVPICQAPIRTTVLPITTPPGPTLPAGSPSEAGRVTRVTPGNTTTTGYAVSGEPPTTRLGTGSPGPARPIGAQLETGSIIGITAGVAVLIVAVIGIVIYRLRKRPSRSKRSDNAVPTGESTYQNNSYALPEISQQNQASTAPPVYSDVVKQKPVSDDVNTAYSYVGNSSTNERQSPSKDNTELYSNAMIYENASFETTPEIANNDSDKNHQGCGPPITMEGNSGWVENIIYE